MIYTRGSNYAENVKGLRCVDCSGRVAVLIKSGGGYRPNETTATTQQCQGATSCPESGEIRFSSDHSVGHTTVSLPLVKSAEAVVVHVCKERSVCPNSTEVQARLLF